MFHIEAFKNTLRYLAKKDEDVNVGKICRTHFYASAIMALTSLIMTVQNVRNDSWTMAVATTILVVGFSLNMVVSGVLKNHKLSSATIALLAGVVLSAFIVGGGNQGFACLWVLLVPLVAVTLLGVVPGTALSLYFMVFILVLFYTPLNSLIVDKYTVAHMQRFPVLYACDMALALFLALQREYYVRKLKESSFHDELTGAFNRNFFLNEIEKAEVIHSKNLAVIMIDLNGLKVTNDTKGHVYGDELLIGLVKVCKSALGEDVSLFRMGGDEFVIMMNDPKAVVEQHVEKLQAARIAWRGKLNNKLEFALGYATREEFPNLGPEELMKEADQRMYADKVRYYAEHDRRAH